MKIVANTIVLKDLPYTISLDMTREVHNLGKVLRHYLHSTSATHPGDQVVTERRAMVKEILEAIGETTSGD